MAVNKVSGVSWVSVSKFAGVGTAAISKIDGDDAALAQTTWGVTGQDGATGYAMSINIAGNENWTGYRDPNSTTDCGWIAYGKDGSGNPLWIKGSGDNNREMMYSSDITTDGTWNSLNLANPADKSRIIWGAQEETWVAAGEMSSTTAYSYHTSSDGTTGWGAVSLSGVTTSTTSVRGLATNGTGTWIVGQNAKVYTTNNLAAGSAGWVLLNDFGDSRDIIMAGYSTGRWFITYRDFKPGGGDGEGVANALAADSGSWTDSADLNLGGAIPAGTKNSAYATSTASADYATVIVVNSNDVSRSTDSGANFTKMLNVLPFGSGRAIATDGEGVWMVGHDDSRVSYSIDDGTTWSTAKDGTQVSNGGWGSGGDSDIDGIAASVFLPL